MSTRGLTTGPGAEKGLRPKPDHRILLRPPGSKPRIQEMRSSEKEKYFITEIDKNPNHNLLLPPARLQPVSHHCKLHFRRFDRPPDWKTKTLPRWQLWPSGSEEKSPAGLHPVIQRTKSRNVGELLLIFYILTIFTFAISWSRSRLYSSETWDLKKLQILQIEMGGCWRCPREGYAGKRIYSDCNRCSLLSNQLKWT